MSSDAQQPESDVGRATTSRIKEEWNNRAHDGFRYLDNRARSEAQFEAFGERDAERMLAGLVEPLSPDARVLEIGCGNGRLLGPLARLFSEVWGVDVSDEMIRLARQRLAHLANVRLHLNNGTDLGDLPSGHFDFCCSLYMFEHIPERWIAESYLREAARVLADGGVLKIQAGAVYPRNPYRAAFDRERGPWAGVRFTLSELAALVEEAGFDMISAYHPHEQGPGHSDWDDPLPQRRVWVVARKGDGMDDWERMCLSIAHTLRDHVAPGRRVITPHDRLRWYLNAAGAGHIDLVASHTPTNDADAIRMLEDLKGAGPSYLLLSRHTEWWLTEYPGLAAHLRARGREVARTNDTLLFELP